MKGIMKSDARRKWRRLTLGLAAAGAITALCDLREIIPYAFGYMMAAKVGTGFVAEIGSMRISSGLERFA